MFVPHLDAKQFSLGDELATILRHQLAFLQTGIGPNDYTDLREFLMNDQRRKAHTQRPSKWGRPDPGNARRDEST